MKLEKQIENNLINRFSTKLDNAMKMYLDVCARCGVCIDKCHAYASTNEIRYSPVERAEVVRKLYRRYYKNEGRLFPSIGEVSDFSELELQKLYDAAFSCTGCRRCMQYCPFGIDTQMIMSIAKVLLIEAEKQPQILKMLADMSIAKGKTIMKTKDNFATAMANLEKEVLEKWKKEGGEKVIPLEIQDADVLYVALAGKHSIVSAASIMNAAKEKWSLSYFEAVNFGAFVGNPEKTQEIALRIIDEAKKLNVKEVIICECGTAYRVMRDMLADNPSINVITFVQLIHRYIKENRINLSKDKLDGIVTYHDPCQIARNGGIYSEPREILNSITDNFKDMSVNPMDNWCCGGGGGIGAIGEKSFKMKSAKVKADQIASVKPDLLVTSCENCHTQLDELTKHYKSGCEVKFLSAVVADSLIE